ncbi:lanthionine synthetase C family protein [Streptomyces avicenniae]|uniref:lanthionine synthetase C family protein n=1 Tax=Streptomyces avicenniae TaxID=500153 RepID=UPI00069C8A66|nr:lanthionine synthetase C family protein [Streptomyces avicenniae]
MHPAPRHRDQARTVAARIRGALADPGAAAADTGPASPWGDLSLANGYPGVSLAFSGSPLGGADHARLAAACLDRATTAAAHAPPGATGIHDGTGALAFALLVAHRATGDHLDALDRLATRWPRPLHAATTPGLGIGADGLTGIGRHLLARDGTATPGLRAVLAHLITLSRRTVPRHGRTVPAWWSAHDDRLHLGLAHGIAGPLALLSLAHRAGVVLDGQRDAIERLVGLLTDWAVRQGDGILWPAHLTPDEWAAGPRHWSPAPSRPTWSDGAPGTARAVQLAALALGRHDWHTLAHRALLPLITQDPEKWGLDSPGIRHGWSGVLHLTGLLAAHLDDGRLRLLHDEIASILLAHHDPRSRFCYRFTAPDGRPAASPGFLDGAAGVALALDTYAGGGGPAVRGWDMALLLA